MNLSAASRLQNLWIGFVRFLLRSYIRFSPMNRGKPRLWAGYFTPYVLNHIYATTVRTRQGFRMRVELPDNIQTTIYLTGAWEPFITRYFQEVLGGGDVFVDVGANVGYYSLLASRLVGPSGSVFAIEGSPTIFRRLQQNLLLNRADNISPIAVAISSKPGHIDFWLAPETNIGHSTSVASLASRENLQFEAKVRAVTLDQAVPMTKLLTARIVKIDVEGAERDVLLPIAPLLSEFSQRTEWVVEVDPSFCAGGQADVNWVFDMFSTHGYRAFGLHNAYDVASLLSRPKHSQLLPLDVPPTTLTDILFSRSRR
jgi:FkbM family methyltransferase